MVCVCGLFVVVACVCGCFVDIIIVWVIDTMGFTVCLRSHVVCPPCNNTAGTDAVLPVDAGQFSDDFSEFIISGKW